MRCSFIIPVYNGEKYIEECLNSVLAQTVQDFEVVIIDDGSKDKSGEICDRYAEKYFCIRVFHVENGGVCTARNLGIEKAEGDYICFVDADDVVSPLIVERVPYGQAEAGGAPDILFFGYTKESAEKLSRTESASRQPENVQWADKQEILDRTIYDPKKGQGINCYTVWAKLFKRELLSGIRFVKGIKIGEDKLFNFEAFLKAENMAYQEDIMYYCRPNGASVMMNYSKDYEASACATFEGFDRLIEDLENRPHYEELLSRRAVVVMKNFVILDICHKKNEKPYKERKLQWKQMMEESPEGKYFRMCNGKKLNSDDRFFWFAYRHSFFRVNLMTRCKMAKAIELAIYLSWKRLTGKS